MIFYKRIITLFLIFTLFFSFFGCTSKVIDNINLSAEEIISKIELALLSSEEYYKPTENYFKYYFKDDSGISVLEDGVSSWSIHCSKDQASESEYGVIIANSGNVSRIENACMNYIERQRLAYLNAKAAYSMSEYDKYDNAEVMTRGNIIFYAILSEKDTDIFEDTVENLYK